MGDITNAVALPRQGGHCRESGTFPTPVALLHAAALCRSRTKSKNEMQ